MRLPWDVVQLGLGGAAMLVLYKVLVQAFQILQGGREREAQRAQERDQLVRLHEQAMAMNADLREDRAALVEVQSA
jgi:hypothetical protein